MISNQNKKKMSGMERRCGLCLYYNIWSIQTNAPSGCYFKWHKYQVYLNSYHVDFRVPSALEKL